MATMPEALRLPAWKGAVGLTGTLKGTAKAPALSVAVAGVDLLPETAPACVPGIGVDATIAYDGEAAVVHVTASEGRREEPLEVVLARPAIAVLPMVALDGEARSVALGRALAYDLAGLFAASCWFPVIAPVSTEGARKLGATCQQIGAALGARFLVDGALSVRGATWRLAVHIDDTQSGECLWSARHDFGDDELFAVQDDVCARIAATTLTAVGPAPAPRPERSDGPTSSPCT